MQNTSALAVESSEKEKSRGKSSEFSEASTYWFPVYEGLFEHAQTIRDAVWFFMWIIARTTVERDGAGRVLGGIPIDDGRPAREIGVSVKVIRRWRRILLKGGYILAVRTGSGFKYTLLKSKKYQYRDRPNRPISQKNQTGNQDREVPERADQIGSGGQIRSAGAGSSNKKIQGQHKGFEEAEAPQSGATVPTATPTQSAPVLKEPWEVLGLTMPIGGVAFQGEWESFYASRTNPQANVAEEFILVKNVVDTMEEFIQLKLRRGQKDIPPKFYDLKHEQERLHKEMIEEIDEAQRWAEANFEFERRLDEKITQRQAEALPATSGQVILMAPLPAQTPEPTDDRQARERTALAIVLRDPAALENDPRIKKLEPGNFADERHEAIFAGMLRMRSDGKAITVEYLAAYLQGRGELDRAGGLEYVKALVDVPRKAATA